MGGGSKHTEQLVDVASKDTRSCRLLLKVRHRLSLEQLRCLGMLTSTTPPSAEQLSRSHVTYFPGSTIHLVVWSSAAFAKSLHHSVSAPSLQRSNLCPSAARAALLLMSSPLAGKSNTCRIRAVFCSSQARFCTPARTPRNPVETLLPLRPVQRASSVKVGALVTPNSIRASVAPLPPVSKTGFWGFLATSCSLVRWDSHVLQ